MGLEPAVGNVGEKKKENEKKSTDPRKIKGKKRTAASRRRTNERTTTTTKWRRVAMTTQSALSLAYYSVPVAPFFSSVSLRFFFLPSCFLVLFSFFFSFFFIASYCFFICCSDPLLGGVKMIVCSKSGRWTENIWVKTGEKSIPNHSKTLNKRAGKKK